MKKIFTLSVLTISLTAFHFSVNAQAYRKGSLMISVSEGHTLANYSTKTLVDGKEQNNFECPIVGVRDPLVVEFGLSNRWSVALSTGNDVFEMNPTKAYGFSTSTDKVKISTSEFNAECSYHVFVNKRLDLSVFAATGVFSIKMQGNDNDNFYKYTSNGNIVRYGTRVHYYFWKRLGLVGMVSNYFANSSPKDVKDNNVAKNYTTKIHGIAIEGGLCFRLLK